MENNQHKSMEQLQAGLENILQAPKDLGTVELIVCRPSENERKILDEGQLVQYEGLIGDTWRERGSDIMPDGSAHPNQQVAIMNTRVINLLTGEKEVH